MTARPINRFWRYGFPVLAYLGCIFYLSSQSSLGIPMFSGADKLAHLGAYGLMGVLLARALDGYGQSPRRVLVLAAVGCLLYGASDEFHQSFTPNREPDLKDLLADGLGGTLGAALWSIARGRWPRLRPDTRAPPTRSQGQLER